MATRSVSFAGINKCNAGKLGSLFKGVSSLGQKDICRLNTQPLSREDSIRVEMQAGFELFADGWEIKFKIEIQTLHYKMYISVQD